MVATGRPGTRRTWRGGLGGWAGTKGSWWPGDPSPPSVAAAALPPTWAAVVPVCAAVRAAAVPMSPPQPRSAPPAPPAGTRARALAAQGHRQARPGCPSAAGGQAERWASGHPHPHDPRGYLHPRGHGWVTGPAMCRPGATMDGVWGSPKLQKGELRMGGAWSRSDQRGVEDGGGGAVHGPGRISKTQRVME